MMYAAALAGMIICGTFLLLAFIFYVRAQWVFWFYYGEELYCPIGFIMVLLFSASYADMLLPLNGANLLSSALIFMFASAAQYVCGQVRLAEMHNTPPWCWEHYAKKFMPVFIVAVVALRFAFAGCLEYRENYRWNNAESVEGNSEVRVFNGKQIKRPVSELMLEQQKIGSAVAKERQRAAKAKRKSSK